MPVVKKKGERKKVAEKKGDERRERRKSPNAEKKGEYDT